MAARDRFDWELVCPKCAAKGRVHVSEDDYPFMRDPHFTVDEISPGFSVKKKGRSAPGTEIICDKCQVVI